MKRIFTFIIVFATIISACHMAWAIEVRVKGQWKFGIGWFGNRNFYSTSHDNDHEDTFRGRHRVRTQIDFIASENLKATYMMEIGNIYWGYNHGGSTSGRSTGGQLDADGVNVETKYAYLDWMVPGTDLAVRMGIQKLSLPSATGFGNPILSSDVAGVSANYAFNDTVSATVFWIRPFDYGWNDGDRRLYDETDMFGLVVPVKLGSVKLTPWASYASIGGASGYWAYRAGNQSDLSTTPTTATNRFNERSDTWWAGLGAELNMFDPLSIRFDVTYGHMSGSSDGNVATNIFADLEGNPKSSGWFIDAIIDYKASWGTPGLIGWYSTGDKYEDTQNGEFGRMPILGGDSGFGPTYFSTCNQDGWPWDKALTRSGIGMWAVGARIRDLTFIENLSHWIGFTYMRGTNDKDIVSKNGMTNPLRGGRGQIQSVFGEFVYMTTGDAAYEVNVVSWYKLYEGFTVQLDLGWIKLDLDDAWKKDGDGLYGTSTSDAWKAEVIFNWAF